MNGQEYAAYQPPKFTEMTKEQIVSHFAKYCFVDQEGHKLEQCDDFIQLIECVVANE
ncbi:hypothetical protein [Gallibacterium salpingitidis]|uniref:hypothetical protein n=1 Tax=Gallibacterium salpingitidis TaxID=505341 RepID=UPI0012E74C8C|nr:hypothetical protein [Gallibacterium salpingitidis]